MQDSVKTENAFNNWFDSLLTYKQTGGLPARGSVAAALVVLERLQEDYQLDLSFHQAGGRAQLKGLNSPAVASILARFGETRPFLGEGGRTNRGGPGDVQKMLETLRSLHLEGATPEERCEVLHTNRCWLKRCGSTIIANAWK